MKNSMNILLPEQCDERRPDIGGKTKRLRVLQQLGYPVPPFVALPTTVVMEFSEEQSVIQQIVQALPARQYAVRSSALIEDAQEHSHAGQFRTELGVSPQELHTAIRRVIEDAAVKLHNDLTQFSVLIQEYIPASSAGVVFTRDPLGGREFVIEHHDGRGEELVSGKTHPHMLRWYWNTPIPSAWQQLINASTQIEQHFAWPQDIEWCTRGDALFFLQSRPITTITKEQYALNRQLDTALPHSTPFLYEKTSITEIAPRPTPFTFTLLTQIYAQHGPVARVYQQCGIRYAATDFLRLINGELYIDREQELRSLLPAYSYFPAGIPKRAHLRGLATSYRNIILLNRIAPRKQQDLADQLIAALEKPIRTNDFQQSVTQFLSEYELIFCVNLIAEKATKMLEFSLKSTTLTMSDALAAHTSSSVRPPNIDTRRWKGNSLDISDKTPFLATTNEHSIHQPQLRALPALKRQYIERLITQAHTWNRYREYGRWLTVKWVNHLRPLVPPQHATQHTLQNTTLPSRLASFFPQNNAASQPIGVSAGSAEGVLCTREELDRHSPAGDTRILYTSVLSPELTAYFPKITGIISQNGGLLSHLAIIAREQQLPVIVNVSLATLQLQLGDRIRINGSTGAIQKTPPV